MVGTAAKTIVLVHGGFVDGSGWEKVYHILKKDGFTVSIVQNPTISLEDVFQVVTSIGIRTRAPGPFPGGLFIDPAVHLHRS
jgi:hypothetical protein